MVSSYSCSLIRKISHLAFFVLVSSSLIGVAALAQEPDQIAIYFDSAYTENEVVAETLPAYVPAYLVLNNPSASAGVGGWECRLTIEGPGSLLATDLNGSAINVGSGFTFIVGISPPPLPWETQMLLATLTIEVTGGEPVILSLVPVTYPSIPEQMAYLNADGSEELIPMTTADGDPMVAFINGSSIRLCTPTEEFVSFPETAVGITSWHTIPIANEGLVSLHLDVQFDGLCDDFVLADGSGAFDIDPGEILNLDVGFSPSILGYQECSLSLGGTCPDIPLNGTGREAMILWEAPTEVDFGVVRTDVPQSVDVTITNAGELDLPVAPFLDPGCDGFQVSPTGPFNIEPGQSLVLTVDFAPSEATPYACALELGDVVPAIQLTGTGRLPVTSWTAPSALDFGDVDYRESVTLPVLIDNTGDLPIAIEFSTGGCNDQITLSAVAPVTIEPGQSHAVTVTFTPTLLGEFSCSLGLGATIPAIALTGRSLNEVTELTVTPSPLVFPMTLAGESRVVTVSARNTGNTTIHLEPALDPAGEEFSFVSGADPVDLVSGQEHIIEVAFLPQAMGDFAATLTFGADLPVVAVSGTSTDAVYDCLVLPTEIHFGTVQLGGTATREMRVINRGNLPLYIDATSSNGMFSLAGGPFTVYPGQDVGRSVTFRPTAEGYFESEILLGPNFCSPIYCTGTGEMPPNWDQNLVGFTFAPISLEYGQFENVTYANVGSLVVTYLAMINPSSMDPMWGWECCASIEGPAEFLSWQLEPSAINVLGEPCFMVGLGEPQPPAPYYILATGFVMLHGEGVITLRLGSVDYPSIPGEMAWSTGPEGYEILVPMKTFTAMPEVAYINATTIVGVSAPLPTAEVTGGAVNLQWTVGEGDFDGCLVYRRGETGETEQLNREPLSFLGRSFQFTDNPVGYDSGAVFYYSYALVKNGMELARSPEVEVSLKAMPELSTRLLPNVPNPFNPQTDIRFELQTDGPVQVTIYDVTGRRIRTLVSESMNAGPQSRTWFGKDDRGRQAPSGAYYIRLETDGRVDHRKVMLLK
jgi:FlgD Ig-like domain/HYDIN/CFA65/VesB-like, Ig-like domain